MSLNDYPEWANQACSATIEFKRLATALHEHYEECREIEDKLAMTLRKINADRSVCTDAMKLDDWLSKIRRNRNASELGAFVIFTERSMLEAFRNLP